MTGGLRVDYKVEYYWLILHSYMIVISFISSLFQAVNCKSEDRTPYGMLDRFEQLHRPSDFWRRILGGHLGLSCGKVDSGNALIFDGDGTREAVTVPLNTANVRYSKTCVKRPLSKRPKIGFQG